MRIRDIKANIDMVVAGAAVNDWTWVDAIQMGMPVFAKLGVMSGGTTYFEKMYRMYANTKNVQGGAGLYSKTDHLWWRDQDFDPPYTEPNGRSCYWSRGNGWVYAALVRVLDIIPATEAHRAEYLADFQAMSEALRAVQRSDGFWNVSLFDPTNFGGKELTGTSLFTYGMAWGVRQGHLSAATYQPVITRAWNAMVTDSVHTNGFLGYQQGTGKQPPTASPLATTRSPTTKTSASVASCWAAAKSRASPRPDARAVVYAGGERPGIPSANTCAAEGASRGMTIRKKVVASGVEASMRPPCACTI